MPSRGLDGTGRSGGTAQLSDNLMPYQINVTHVTGGTNRDCPIQSGALPGPITMLVASINNKKKRKENTKKEREEEREKEKTLPVSSSRLSPNS
jgi:hypothetical protein